MATSPRTRKAAATSREYARRTADALVEQSRRLSAYTRDQFGRDPRRAWMVTAAVGAALLVLLFVFIASTSGDDQTAGPGEPSAAATTSPIAAGAESANSAPNTATGAATPSPASAGQSLPGTPFSETAVTSALQSRGLNAILVSEPFTCQNASTTPKTYRVTAAGAEQRFVLLVYPNAAGMNGDWVIGAGRPQYRNGDCAAGAAVIYFNQNVLLVFPQTTSAAAQAQIADAFLTLP